MSETCRHDRSIDRNESSLPRPFLSVIIPAFNEAGRLPAALGSIVDFFGSQGIFGEVIVVDNASTDRTAGITADFASRYPFIRYLYEATRGKGAAVRTGILAGEGDYLLISDADLAVPLTEVKKLLSPLQGDFDIAIGSRESEGAVRYNEPSYRHLMGRVFNRIVRLLVLPDIRDTQCGFKCFRRDAARRLFSKSKINGWSFDVEILCMAREKGYRVIEQPVNWYYGAGSKVRPLRDTWLMLRELIRIRRKCRGGR